MISTPPDEAAPAVSAGAFRRPRARTVALRDGRSVRVRPVEPADADRLREFDGGLCEASHRFRYLGWVRPLSPEQSVTMATVDFRHRFAIVATAGRKGDEVIVADCRLIADPAGAAELAIAVADDHQGLGLGPILIRQVLSIAAEHGIGTVEARVRYDNERMMRVLRRLGFRRTAWELGVVTFSASTPRRGR